MADDMRPGLYDPAQERDSCGFGLIANLDHQPSAWVVETALSSLARMSHRGAIGADGKTGDGCGVLLHKPEAFLRAVAEENGLRLGHSFSAGNLFLPRDEAQAARARQVLGEELARVEVRVAGWRVVPTDESACGLVRTKKTS